MDISFFLKPQNPLLDPPAHQITRKWMKLALASGYVRRVGQNAVQAVADLSLKELKDALRAGTRPIHRSAYIPDKMPPREVPGVYFKPPQSDTWKLAHQTVRFLPASL